VNHPFVSIVIPVFNEERYIASCLNSLTKLNYPSEKLEIILVDNGSTDRTMEIASTYDIKLYEYPGVKVGAVRNYGASQAKGEIIVFLDSDCVVSTDWISTGLNCLSQNLDAVGGLYLLRNKPAWVERYWILNSGRDFAYQNTFVGGCIFIYHNAFAAVGGFDELMSAGEDTDLTCKLKHAGYKIDIDPKISVIHLGYPETALAFLKRQMWHSENYYQNFPAVLKDKIFLLTNVFFLGLIIMLLSPWLEINLWLTGGSMLTIPPAVLSVKRIARYKLKSIKITDILPIYTLDVLYLTGRICGSIKSLRNLAKRSSIKKS
jgi:glycosyltransferase involved in cell wall biosynthesis